jgi:hypothetical protein
LRLRTRIAKVFGRRSLRAALLLLLVVHAAQASAAHTHLTGNLATRPASGAAASVSRDGDSRDAREDENEAQCLLCRLQRNLSSSLYNSAPTFTEPSAKPVTAEAVSPESTHNFFRRAPSGRAPPRL